MTANSPPDLRLRAATGPSGWRRARPSAVPPRPAGHSCRGTGRDVTAPGAGNSEVFNSASRATGDDATAVDHPGTMLAADRARPEPPDVFDRTRKRSWNEVRRVLR
ncbi:hypothetical protein GCM10023235_77630 [Kitasatospora terrestris]|uniref:Uncharacterized protein n=1 Tax=Kitasatospora terrestris TaxID=258051 RepID=A0ABP9ETT5_9ACTN